MGSEVAVECTIDSLYDSDDARVAQIEHLAPTRYELVRVLGYWI